MPPTTESVGALPYGSAPLEVPPVRRAGGTRRAHGQAGDGTGPVCPRRRPTRAGRPGTPRRPPACRRRRPGIRASAGSGMAGPSGTCGARSVPVVSRARRPGRVRAGQRPGWLGRTDDLARGGPRGGLDHSRGRHRSRWRAIVQRPGDGPGVGRGPRHRRGPPQPDGRPHRGDRRRAGRHDRPLGVLPRRVAGPGAGRGGRRGGRGRNRRRPAAAGGVVVQAVQEAVSSCG